jgi:hypothetical protein
MTKVTTTGGIMFVIGIILMAIHDHRWGDPFVHGDSWGMIGVALFVAGLGVLIVGLWGSWKAKR